MGIIQRQALKNSVAGFLSTAIAAISTLFIYPLSEATMENYGYAQFVIMSAIFFSAFASFGTPALIVKFFPSLSEVREQKDSYLFNMFFITSLIFVLFIALAVVFREPIYLALDSLGFDLPLIRSNAIFILGLTYVVLLISLLVNHSSNYHRTVVPEILQNLIPKLVLPVLILLFFWEMIDTRLFIWLWCACYVIILLSLVYYLFRLGALDLRPSIFIFRKNLLKKMASFASFNGIGIMGNVLATRIDVLMVATLLGKGEAGYYTIALFIANIVFIPTKAIWAIASPVISRSWEAGDKQNIQQIYQKASINLLVVGIFLYFLLAGSLDSIFRLSANYEELAPALGVFIWLGIAKLSDMGSSVNFQVIMYSDQYRANLFFTVVMGILNALLNYFLIFNMGLVGAAIATAISLITVNIMRMLFIHFRFRMLPFNKDTLKIGILLFYAVSVYFLMPSIESPVVHILVYGVLLTVPYAVLVIWLNISPDMLSVVRNGVSSLRRFLR